MYKNPLILVQGNVILRDTGSLHGTFVNDIKVGNDFDIHQGDIIRFGDKVSRLAGKLSLIACQQHSLTPFQLFTTVLKSVSGSTGQTP